MNLDEQEHWRAQGEEAINAETVRRFAASRARRRVAQAAEAARAKAIQQELTRVTADTRRALAAAERREAAAQRRSTSYRVRRITNGYVRTVFSGTYTHCVRFTRNKRFRPGRAWIDHERAPASRPAKLGRPFPRGSFMGAA